MQQTTDSRARLEGAILGMFIGDALAMPVHWYYDRQALVRDYGRITGYQAPKNPHPDSILWRSRFEAPSPAFDILHEQRRYWGLPGIHYHQFLEAGENTLNLKLCALLIDGITARGAYDSKAYLEDYVAFMTTPGRHRDTYVEEYHRHFFSNYARGKPARACGVEEKHISGLIGMIPLIVHLSHEGERARRLALQHLQLTHRGARMAAAGELLVDLLLPVLGGASLADTIVDGLERQTHPHLGFPLRRWLTDPDDTVIGRRLSSACYVEDAVPATVYLALKYARDPEQGLIVNTNLGGDNAGRGAVLGALLGAANGIQSFPAPWVEGLRHPPEGLDRFLDTAGGGGPMTNGDAPPDTTGF